MEKTKFAKFIDNFTIFFVCFIVLFILFKTKVNNNLICLFFSFFVSLVIFLIILNNQNKKLKQLSIKNKEKNDIIKYNFALRKMSESSQLTFFKNMLINKDIKKTTNGLLVENKVLISINLNSDEIYPENIFKIYAKVKNMKGAKPEEICLICNNINEDVNSILKNFDIKFTIFSPVETYAMMKRFSYFPETNSEQIKIKKNVFKESFMKEKSKSFFKSSLVLFVFSMFVPFTKYYLITASILLLLGTICLCFGKQKIIIEPLSKQILLTKNAQ